MRVLTKQFDASVSELKIACPAGAELLNLRMSAHGNCEAVFQAPDEDCGDDSVRILILREDQGNQGGGDAGQWKHVGSWTYMNGTIAHGFVAVASPKPVKEKPPRRARRTAARPPVDGQDAER